MNQHDDKRMQQWLGAQPLEGLLDDFIKGEREASYRAGWSDNARNGHEGAIAAGRQQGYEEGSKDKAEAVEAEHIMTLGDMDLLGCKFTKKYPMNDQSHLFKWVRARMEARYAERMSPPPAKVLVRMLQEGYDKLAGGFKEVYDVHLVEPGETE